MLGGVGMPDGRSSAEKRFAPRRQRKLPAVLYAEGLGAGVRCHIVDLSSTGARICLAAGWDNAMHDTGREPQRVRVVELAEKVIYECWIVRRGETDAGLRFAAPPVLPAATAARRSR